MLTTSTSLLNRLRQPNQPQAWERFVKLYAPLLLVWARRQGLREADAEDLVQQVLLKLLDELPAYQRGAGQSFRGWLFRVTANQCQDFRRRKATRALPAADGLANLADPSPAADLEEQEYRRLLVQRGLQVVRPDFNETTWAAFTRVMLEGRSPAEVAAELNVSTNAVYLARHRVLTRLREELDGLLD
jgi:RNA polymerase sigma-70 factor (ECF subfamily)